MASPTRAVLLLLLLSPFLLPASVLVDGVQDSQAGHNVRGAASSPPKSEPAAASPVFVDPNLLVKPPLFPQEESWPGSCRLRSKRYVSDGLCVSLRPVSEVVCAVSCVMNAWIKGGSRPLPWRCTDNGWKRQRVRLLCRDGATRFYRIRVVQSCRCVPRAVVAAQAAQAAQAARSSNQLD